jgi:hypothetical protein
LTWRWEAGAAGTLVPLSSTKSPAMKESSNFESSNYKGLISGLVDCYPTFGILFFTGLQGWPQLILWLCCTNVDIPYLTKLISIKICFIWDPPTIHEFFFFSQ